MSQPRLPWEPSYVPPAIDGDLLKTITSMAENAVNQGTQFATSIGSQVAGQVAGPAAAQAIQEVGSVAQATENAVEGVASVVLPTILPPPGALTPPPPGSAQTNTPGDPEDWVGAIEAAALATGKGALQVALPFVQDRIAHEAEKIIAQELGKALGNEEPPLATIPAGSLTKLDAWERALRTFAVGLFFTVLAGVVQVIGSLATDGTSVDFFHKDGWVAVGGLLTASVVNSFGTYVLRYLKEPAGAALDSSKKS